MSGAPLVGAREELTARAESWARGARAEQDVGGLRAAVGPLRGLVRGVGERALPADPLTVARFLADLAPRWRPATPADPPGIVVAGQVRERDGMRPGTLGSVNGGLVAIPTERRSARRQPQLSLLAWASSEQSQTCDTYGDLCALEFPDSPPRCSAQQWACRQASPRVLECF